MHVDRKLSKRGPGLLLLVGRKVLPIFLLDHGGRASHDNPFYQLLIAPNRVNVDELLALGLVRQWNAQAAPLLLYDLVRRLHAIALRQVLQSVNTELSHRCNVLVQVRTLRVDLLCYLGLVVDFSYLSSPERSRMLIRIACLVQAVLLYILKLLLLVKFFILRFAVACLSWLVGRRLLFNQRELLVLDVAILLFAFCLRRRLLDYVQIFG